MKWKQPVLSACLVAATAMVPISSLLATEPGETSVGSSVQVRSLPGDAALITVADFSRKVGNGASLEADSATFYSLPDPKNLAPMRYELTNAYILSANPQVAPMYLGNAAAVVDGSDLGMRIFTERVVVPAGWAGDDGASSRMSTEPQAAGVSYSCHDARVYADDVNTGQSSICAGWQIACTDEGISLEPMETCS